MEPLVEHNQNLTGQNNCIEPIQPIPLIDVSSLLKEGEGVTEASQRPNDVPSNESTKSLEGDAVEWRKGEDILSHLGLQLIPTNKTAVTEGSIATASRKKGFRELQNLKFNVNYDCGGCSIATASRKILSWNIRGSGSSSKRRAIRQAICKANLDIVVLQETKWEEVSRSFVGSIWRSRFKEWLVLPAVGIAGGLLVMWDVRRVKVKRLLVRGIFGFNLRRKRRWQWMVVFGHLWPE